MSRLPPTSKIEAYRDNSAPYVSIATYVFVSFLQDSNTMLYRYLWLPIEQYSEREMTMLSFDCLLK